MRTKAFTLIEVLVAMGITSILVIFAYSAFLFYNNEIKKKIERNKFEMELLRLDEALQEDFFNESILQLENSSLMVKKKDQVINYNFEDTYVKRIQGFQIDVFPLEIREVKGYFLNENEPSRNGKIDKLILRIKNTKDFKLVYLKKYSAEDLINN